MNKVGFARQYLGPSTSLVQSAFFVLSSDVFSRIATAVLTLVLARLISVQDFGFYAYANVIALILVISPQASLDQWTQNEVGRDPQKAGRVFFTVLLWKGIVFLAGMALGLCVVWGRGYGRKYLAMAGLVFLMQGGWTLHTGVHAFLKSMQRFSLDFVLRILANLALLGLCGGALWVTRNVLWFLVTGMCVYVTISLLGVAGLHRLVGLKRVIPDAGLGFVRIWIGNTAPYLASVMLALAYVNADTLTLEVLLGQKTVGYYKAASQIALLLSIVPSGLFGLLLPALAFTHAQDQEIYRQRMSACLQVLVVVTFVLSLILSLFSKDILILLFRGKFDVAALLVQRLAAAAVPAAVTATSGVILLHQKDFRKLIGFPMFFLAVNVLVNVFFVPRFDFRWVGYTRMATDCLLFMSYAILIRRLYVDIFPISRIIAVVGGMILVCGGGAFLGDASLLCRGVIGLSSATIGCLILGLQWTQLKRKFLTPDRQEIL